ncbi:hypothetical protein NMY22_g15239 [Coprinellus aureogranulatus]|nr:hypothetical protein NMY22_g15239 [Coprinellus aureogranulatus]
MFTPPTSPRPTPEAVFAKSQERLDLKPTSSSTHLPPPSSSPPIQTPAPSKAEFHQRSREEAKRRIGRRFRNAVILVPLVLIAITLTARMITHGTPPFLSSISSPHSWTSTFLPSKPCHEPHHLHHAGSTSSLGKRSPQLPGVGDTTSTSSTRAPTQTSSSPTVASIPTVPQSSPILPTPFPQSVIGIITKNFSSVSCMNFLTDMANAREFRSCRPFSLLLGSSNDFIARFLVWFDVKMYAFCPIFVLIISGFSLVAAQSNLTLLNELVWGTCNTNTAEDQCITNMATYATNLRTQCAQDLRDNNAVAVSTLKGLESYALMRQTGCLTDPTTNTYCFVNAAADTNPTNLYYYNLPIGIKLPTSADPQCNACLKSIMSLYGAAMRDENVARSLSGLQATYERAAEATLGKCGAGWAQANLVSAAVAVGKGARWLWEEVTLFAGDAFGLGDNFIYSASTRTPTRNHPDGRLCLCLCCYPSTAGIEDIACLNRGPQAGVEHGADDRLKRWRLPSGFCTSYPTTTALLPPQLFMFLLARCYGWYRRFHNALTNITQPSGVGVSHGKRTHQENLQTRFDDVLITLPAHLFPVDLQTCATRFAVLQSASAHGMNAAAVVVRFWIRIALLTFAVPSHIVITASRMRLHHGHLKETAGRCMASVYQSCVSIAPTVLNLRVGRKDAARVEEPASIATEAQSTPKDAANEQKSGVKGTAKVPSMLLSSDLRLPFRADESSESTTEVQPPTQEKDQQDADKNQAVTSPSTDNGKDKTNARPIPDTRFILTDVSIGRTDKDGRVDSNLAKLTITGIPDQEEGVHFNLKELSQQRWIVGDVVGLPASFKAITCIIKDDGDEDVASVRLTLSEITADIQFDHRRTKSMDSTRSVAFTRMHWAMSWKVVDLEPQRSLPNEATPSMVRNSMGSTSLASGFQSAEELVNKAKETIGMLKTISEMELAKGNSSLAEDIAALSQAAAGSMRQFELTQNRSNLEDAFAMLNAAGQTLQERKALGEWFVYR